jgi:hypothetical protein
MLRLRGACPVGMLRSAELTLLRLIQSLTSSFRYSDSCWYFSQKSDQLCHPIIHSDENSCSWGESPATSRGPEAHGRGPALEPQGTQPRETSLPDTLTNETFETRRKWATWQFT